MIVQRTLTLAFARKLMFVLTGAAATVGPILSGILFAPNGGAHLQTPALTFDVAS